MARVSTLALVGDNSLILGPGGGLDVDVRNNLDSGDGSILNLLALLASRSLKNGRICLSSKVEKTRATRLRPDATRYQLKLWFLLPLLKQTK